uniref:Uncharacterized protein n=1 Tax=Cacopsylla melanoneura TaxID=428564 RepID=A0A8D8WX21_9HEMI
MEIKSEYLTNKSDLLTLKKSSMEISENRIVRSRALLNNKLFSAWSEVSNSLLMLLRISSFFLSSLHIFIAIVSLCRFVSKLSFKTIGQLSLFLSSSISITD